MSNNQTIDDIYAALNPMPALLNEKGKARPEVTFQLSANAGMHVTMSWVKPLSDKDWDRHYECFSGDSFEQALGKAGDFIHGLPSAEQAKLHDFMGSLGKLIDASKDAGIAVDYLNPLLDTMKRLSENIITYKPAAA